MITIVDYGLGNVQAVANIYRRLNLPVRVASTAAQLDGAAKLILPGVGAFDYAMTRLNASGMRATLDELVQVRGSAVLGICVGMQMLAQRSDEGELAGLGWIDADVRKFSAQAGQARVELPHMGWNDVLPVHGDCLFRGMERDARFYFLHSYYFAPRRLADVLAETDYHGRFVCAARAGKVFGVQFHPEKSHGWGIQLLKNFAEL